MMTDKQKLEFLNKGVEVCKSAIDFKDSLKKWESYVRQFDMSEIEKLLDSNESFKNLNNEMQRVSKEIEDLIS